MSFVVMHGEEVQWSFDLELLLASHGSTWCYELSFLENLLLSLVDTLPLLALWIRSLRFLAADLEVNLKRVSRLRSLVIDSHLTLVMFG